MARRIAVVAAISLVAAGCGKSSAAPKNHLIVLDHSIGGVSLLERRARVERSLGKGVLKAPRSPNHYVAYLGDKLDVWYGRARVFLIKTASPLFRTFSGVGVGSSARNLQTLPGLDCFGGSVDCQHGYHAMNQRGTSFHLGPDGAVAWIAIAFGH